jgi:hypothetical protein
LQENPQIHPKSNVDQLLAKNPEDKANVQNRLFFPIRNANWKYPNQDQEMLPFSQKVGDEKLDCIQKDHESSFRGEDHRNLKKRKFIHEKFTEEIEKW